MTTTFFPLLFCISFSHFNVVAAVVVVVVVVVELSQLTTSD